MSKKNLIVNGGELPEVDVVAEKKKYPLYNTATDCTSAGAKAVEEGGKYKCECGKYALNLQYYKCEDGVPIDKE